MSSTAAAAAPRRRKGARRKNKTSSPASEPTEPREWRYQEVHDHDITLVGARELVERKQDAKNGARVCGSVRMSGHAHRRISERGLSRNAVFALAREQLLSKTTQKVERDGLAVVVGEGGRVVTAYQRAPKGFRGKQRVPCEVRSFLTEKEFLNPGIVVSALQAHPEVEKARYFAKRRHLVVAFHKQASDLNIKRIVDSTVKYEESAGGVVRRKGDH